MIFLGVLVTIVFLIGIGVASFFEFRKTKLVAKQEEDLRQLVRRYEQLAENALDGPAAGGRRRLRAALAHDLDREDPAHGR